VPRLTSKGSEKALASTLEVAHIGMSCARRARHDTTLVPSLRCPCMKTQPDEKITSSGGMTRPGFAAPSCTEKPPSPPKNAKRTHVALGSTRSLGSLAPWRFAFSEFAVARRCLEWAIDHPQELNQMRELARRVTPRDHRIQTSHEQWHPLVRQSLGPQPLVRASYGRDHDRCRLELRTRRPQASHRSHRLQVTSLVPYGSS